jgi:hypothetical protein
LDTAILRLDLSRVVGQIDGGGLTQVAYAVPEMWVRTVILGFRWYPLESEGRAKELSEMFELQAAILASVIQKGNLTEDRLFELAESSTTRTSFQAVEV